MHVMFGLTIGAFLFGILAGQSKVSLKLLDTDICFFFFCFDTLCQLAYMIYITKANAIMNILSRLKGYLLFTMHRRVLKRSQGPLVGWGGVEFGQFILMKII